MIWRHPVDLFRLHILRVQRYSEWLRNDLSLDFHRDEDALAWFQLYRYTRRVLRWTATRKFYPGYRDYLELRDHASRIEELFWEIRSRQARFKLAPGWKRPSSPPTAVAIQRSGPFGWWLPTDLTPSQLWTLLFGGRRS